MVNMMGRGLAKVFDRGTIETAEAGSSVLAKRSPAEYGLARRMVAAVARSIRRVFNYAPVSRAPYQLRLSWWSGETVNLGWLPVTKEVYDRAEVGSYLIDPTPES